ncbi:uncharacterized protein EI97DRAFT_461346 [Westerdykella ornata]|uniref:BZIP domain-containing protein n=1 Tax=Westerdykella ornata TaxID=318751 RepID=A0A6A6JAT4_WESOR|nr:uncharacterized protein EI97DRAFT_461346 [Westerdykella ornata]KAF2273088.1 hypothetical protein EI97DRAFT_461346 [Westerdykella ornata]
MAAPSVSSPTGAKMSSPPTDSKKKLPQPDEPTQADSKPGTTSAPADKGATATTAALAPPPKPPTSTDAPDYFSQTHSNANPFSLEPNVFEQSFGNPAVETPGRTILPPVANITSPSPLLPGITPGWQSSLRQGPLSPAMLSGPAGTDYFDFNRGFPTPNESCVRTGLTPGGGGSMFPAPSPNTQAMFSLQSQSGVATPNTADFHQSALRASQMNQHKFPPTSAPTSQPDTAAASVQSSQNFQQGQGSSERSQPDPYANHDVSTAANDLISFATQNGAARNGVQPFTLPNQPTQVNNLGHMPVQPVSRDPGRRGTVDSAISADTADFSEESGQSEQKTTTRSRAKKGASNGKLAAGTKRKADEPAKSNSRRKTNNGAASNNSVNDSEEERTSPKQEDTKKMTDEEKRKNFLERNRVAALKCRQRKKQWLANLQQKVETYSQENDTLLTTVAQLREEIINLKTVLLAHKDCSVSVQQGLSGMNMNAFLQRGTAISDNHTNPYGIGQLAAPSGVPMGIPMAPGPNLQNRFVYPPLGPVKIESGASPTPASPLFQQTSNLPLVS